MISHLLSMDIKITKEDKCINLLCSFPDSCDIVVMAIGNNNTTLKTNDVVASFSSKEMWWMNIEESTHDALMVRGRLVENGKAKSSNRK